MALVALVSWFWSAHNTTVYYERQIAAEKAKIEAAYQIEIQREQYAAREIAEAATRRAEDDAQVTKEMQAIIDEYSKMEQEPKNEVAKNLSCDIDDEFARRVQQLSEASYRHPRAARTPSKLRKAR